MRYVAGIYRDGISVDHIQFGGNNAQGIVKDTAGLRDMVFRETELSMVRDCLGASPNYAVSLNEFDVMFHRYFEFHKEEKEWIAGDSDCIRLASYGRCDSVAAIGTDCLCLMTPYNKITFTGYMSSVVYSSTRGITDGICGVRKWLEFVSSVSGVWVFRYRLIRVFDSNSRFAGDIEFYRSAQAQAFFTKLMMLL